MLLLRTRETGKRYSLYPHREGDGTPLQYSCLENPMDRGAWWAAVHGVAKSRTRLSDFTFTFNLKSEVFWWRKIVILLSQSFHCKCIWVELTFDKSTCIGLGRLIKQYYCREDSSPSEPPWKPYCTWPDANQGYSTTVGRTVTSALHNSAAAKSLQSCPTLCDPIDGSPPDLPVPGILQARTLEWVAISFSNAWKWRRSVVSDS